MTTPTAPDGDRLPATNNGQEACVWCLHPRSVHGEEGCEGSRAVASETWECDCVMYRRPAPQQPPAQEHTHYRDHDGVCIYEGCGNVDPSRALDRSQPPAQERENEPTDLYCASEWCPTWQRVRTGHYHPALFGYDTDGALVPAPPSEADSASEVDVPRTQRRLAWFTDVELAVELDRRRAASPGVQGGDGYEPETAPSETTSVHGHTRVIGGDGEARERLARWLADREVPGGWDRSLGWRGGEQMRQRWLDQADDALRAAGGGPRG